MNILDRFLDHVTMYRLVLWHLVALLVAALGLSLFGIVPHDPRAILTSSLTILAVCWLTNAVFARVFEIPANRESVYITALVLILIMDPVAPTDFRGIGALAFAALWATASKFVLAVGHKHVFNPAAFGAAATGLLLGQPATWWVGGNLALLPVVLVGGVMIVRKLQRFDLVTAFIGVVLVTVFATSGPSGHVMALGETLKSSPLFFFAFIMLTEPLTAPTMPVPRTIFAVIVGILFAPNIHIGSFYFTPELALLVGNLFAWAAGPRGRLVLKLQRIEQTAADTYDFLFSSPRKLAFQPGQYLEWTLGVPHADNRGNRRYFTVASAPTEDLVRLGVKFYRRSSAFKETLARMAPGDTIHAAQLAGSFTLPADRTAKLAFLAGGIGITPFRSMLQYLIDREEERPIVVLYGNERQADIAYRDVLTDAERILGIPVVYAVAEGATKGQYAGYIDARLIKTAIPDFKERIFYISGPQAMVQALRDTLTGMGVHRSCIKVDFFPGFA